MQLSHMWQEACMQRPVHPSYGQVKQNVDGCLFVWTGKKKNICFLILMYILMSPVRRTAQSALHVL